MGDSPVAAPQTRALFSLEPIAASVLADGEARRRSAIKELGACRSGCDDLDDYVLSGGLERGCVVGLSAEEEDEMGVLLGLQMLAHALCEESDASTRTALVVTPRTTTAVLVPLRDAIRAELTAQGIAPGDVSRRTRACLDRVMLSCVFDFDGLWEVLADLDRPASPGPSPSPDDAAARGAEEREQVPPPVLEIQDSEDDDDELSPLPTQGGAKTASPRQHQQPEPSRPSSSRSTPDFIIVTHFSTLLTNLFTHREKSAAHAALQLTASHLRHLSRNLPSSPLILLLNSTTPSSPEPTDSRHSTARPPLDPTLRSVFAPPALPGHAHAPTTRRNKPSFGSVFAQLLDLHLLCTLVPRAKEDADALYAPVAEAPGGGHGEPRFVTVVEVLLDEMGVWEGSRGARKSREQRWTAVDVVKGRVCGAFKGGDGEMGAAYRGSERLSAGFGGRRV